MISGDSICCFSNEDRTCGPTPNCVTADENDPVKLYESVTFPGRYHTWRTTQKLQRQVMEQGGKTVIFNGNIFELGT